jgi:superfamily II DNA or RNA helicase
MSDSEVRVPYVIDNQAHLIADVLGALLIKALYEYFKDELGEEQPQPTRSTIELVEFQEDAVKKARKILARFDGVMIADSVGLGKTWIGKKLLEDFAYHMPQKAVVVCPASLRDMGEPGDGR